MIVFWILINLEKFQKIFENFEEFFENFAALKFQISKIFKTLLLRMQ